MSFVSIKKNKKYIYLVLISLVFIFLRTYKISSSLNFQNDIGRDYLRLIEWKQSGKPPILGPQNSAVPFNQSAVYFYLFYPIFIISGQSFLTTFYTCLLFHLVLIWIGFILIQKSKLKKDLTTNYLALFFLSAIHPELVRQHRYVWNPSFVFISIAIASFCFYALKQKYNNFLSWGFSTSLAFAVAMNLSAVPAMIAFMLLSLIKLRKHFIKIILSLLAVGNLFFLPYWLFEIKYKFQIIKRVFGRQILTLNPVGLSFPYKLKKMTNYLLNINRYEFYVGMGIAIILIILFILQLKNKKHNNKPLSELGFNALILLIISLLIIFIAPVTIESHYIFAPLAFFLLLIVNLNNNVVKSIIFSLLLILWLNPAQLSSYFKPASRTFSQLDNCFTKVCSQISDPIYVSAQASNHNYHSAPEFRYLMLKNGCNVKHIEQNTDQAQLMAVISDQSHYEHGQTSFDELTLFGKAQEKKVFHCEADVKVHILEK